MEISFAAAFLAFITDGAGEKKMYSLIESLATGDIMCSVAYI